MRTRPKFEDALFAFQSSHRVASEDERLCIGYNFKWYIDILRIVSGGVGRGYIQGCFIRPAGEQKKQEAKSIMAI